MYMDIIVVNHGLETLSEFLRKNDVAALLGNDDVTKFIFDN